ncbi:MAG: (Na+)-NQR maturation NqrM [Pseudomonadales bacterium]|nr:(Na+)-NQR maturation NqrM [Pseudomonadales bacterium]
MNMILVTFFVMGLVVLGMAVGVIFANKPLKGSCGGLNKIGLEGDCEICGGDMDKCEEESPPSDKQKPFDKTLIRDASTKSHQL